ncbi:MAG TPA: DUF2255 family protein [Gemmatimonadaceae bacterium]|nr:DUF2255 family protein [Gemmatimonadaceae bacterium]
MPASRRFPRAVVDEIRKSLVVGVRAGTEPHRIIGIWAVVADGRVFVRSWSLKERSWYRTFMKEPRGVMTVKDKEYPVRAVRIRSERIKAAVDRAYHEKYHTPASLKYVKDLCRKQSRDTTTELAPR